MLNCNLQCNLPCHDVNRDFVVPKARLDPQSIKMIMISEAPPQEHTQYFYEAPDGQFYQTTRTAFQDAGITVDSYDDIAKLGIYLTTALKCSKMDYLVSTQTLKECSTILEQEIEQFPNLKVIMAMGDFAIKMLNYIYKRKQNRNAITPGSTYKIRKDIHMVDGIRFFPSYTQTGESFNIEKSKRQMIAEDIRAAMEYLR